jgi:hypothetical protein
MSTVRWIGNALPVAQVNTITPANVGVGNTFTITINGKAITFTATAATVANVTAGLVTLLSASTAPPEFQEITWADATTAITATSKVAGRPFTQTSSASGGTATLTTAATTANSGPWNADIAANWSGGAVPVDLDDIVFDSGAVPVKYGLDQSAVTPASVTFTAGYTGTIGLPATNSDNAASTYVEYRGTYLQYGNSGDATTTAITIGGGTGSGSGRIKLDSGTGRVNVVINGTGNAAEASAGVPAVLWKGTHASNTVTISKGTLGIAFVAGETATVATLNVGYQSQIASDATVQVGAGATLTTINQSGGALTVNSNVTTANVTNGTYTQAAGMLGTLNADGGRVIYKTTGALTTANVGSGANLDCSQDMRARTITNINLYEGAEYHDPFGTVTATNGFVFVRCAPKDLKAWDIAPNKTITVA